MNEVRRQIMLRLLEAAAKDEHIIIYPHVWADCDAIGSALALYFILRKLNIRTTVLVDEEVDPKLHFLPGWQLAKLYVEADLEQLNSLQNIALAVDCAEAERTGRRQDLFLEAKTRITLDHHASVGQSQGLRLIDVSAAATAEIIADLINDLSAHTQEELWDQDIAVLLMGALISDTGRFIYSNTTARSFELAAFLMGFKPDLRQITYFLFDANSKARLRLQGQIFLDAEFYFDDKLAMALVEREQLSRFNASEYDLDGVVTLLKNVEGVQVSLVLRELENGSVKVNIRSSSAFNASKFADSHGGGGHQKAAGMILKGYSLEQAANLLKEDVGRLLL